MGFGVARFDRLGNARASDRGTSNRQNSHALFVYMPNQRQTACMGSLRTEMPCNMTESDRIKAINIVLKDYFVLHPNTMISAKELMPRFINEGIFNHNNRDGNPIRKLLRKLYKEKRLCALKYVYFEVKEKNKNWFFTDEKPKNA